MPAERGRIVRRSRAFEIGRRRHEHPPHGADPAGDVAGISQIADAKGDVDALLDQIDDAVAEEQFGPQLRICRQIFADQGTDMDLAENIGRRDHDPPARFAALTLGHQLGLLEIGENAPRAVEKTLARVGEAHSPCGAVQQPDAETLLQRRDMTGRRRGGDAEPARGRRKAALVGDGDEDAYGFEAVHEIIPIYAINIC